MLRKTGIGKEIAEVKNRGGARRRPTQKDIFESVLATHAGSWVSFQVFKILYVRKAEERFQSLPPQATKTETSYPLRE